MAKFEVTKTIDNAKKLNKRSKLPTGETITLPYGAILENPVLDHDRAVFSYLGEPYQIVAKVFREATKPIDEVSLGAAVGAGDIAPVVAAAPELAAAPAVEEPAGPVLAWEALHSTPAARRAKVPGGWLVAVSGVGMTFYPDAKHAWDGGSAE
jgi:hypothetical protein